MFDSELELLDKIRLGESTFLDAKEVRFRGGRVAGPSRNDLADDIASYANSRGGVFVFGVEDGTREIIGIPLDRLDAVVDFVKEVCADKINPPIENLALDRLFLPSSTGEDVAVIKLDILRSLFVHRSPSGYLHRVADSNRHMSPEYLARLLQERSQSRVIRFDETVVPGASPRDVDGDLARRFLRRGAEVTEDALYKLRVVADDEEGAARVTVAGALMCTREPGRWLPHAHVQAVSYAGERRDVNYQLDARDFEGPLDEQVFEAMRFLRRNMFVAATKTTARVEIPQFSERAVFEALVNAVAHRDYSMAGARIRFHLFRNRLELYVPGNLANTLTPDSMDLRQYSRNELIVSLLARCSAGPAGDVGRSRMMDRRGDGVPLILDESRELSGRAPEYTLIDNSELRLVIWAAGLETAPRRP